MKNENTSLNYNENKIFTKRITENQQTHFAQLQWKQVVERSSEVKICKTPFVTVWHKKRTKDTTYIKNKREKKNLILAPPNLTHQTSGRLTLSLSLIRSLSLSLSFSLSHFLSLSCSLSLSLSFSFSFSFENTCDWFFLFRHSCMARPLRRWTRLWLGHASRPTHIWLLLPSIAGRAHSTSLNAHPTSCQFK